MRFANPEALWLLLVLPPALVAFLWWAWRRKQERLTQFIDERLLAALVAGFSPARRKLRLAFLLAAVVCLIFTVARPQWGFDWEETRQRGLDIIVAIDTSKSMLADDITPNRLARAKLAALDLMQQAKSDRLGLVAFAGVAFLQCPLTVDDGAFRECVDALDVNTIPQGGTAIADAIETALTAFKEGDNSKVLVLFSDGEDHDSHAAEAAAKAAAAGLRIFTIGVGTAEGELLRVTDSQGRTDYVRDEGGNVVKSHLNEALLKEIAQATRGFYLPLRGANTIDTLYQRGLSELTKTESEARLVKRYHEHYYWPLALAILLLLAEMLFPERKGPLPAPRTKGVAGAAPGPAALLLLLLALPRTAPASPAGALHDYRAGRYDQALKEYRQLLEKRGDDPRLNFNAGTAAYRDGQFEEAAKRFGEAMTAPDLKLQQDAFYNLGNTHYEIGEHLAEPDKKKEVWEKSLQDFERTLKLDPNDADAKFNHEFVKRRLQQLEQQQSKSDQKKNDQQNPKDNQSASPQDQKQKQPQQGQGEQNKPQPSKPDSAQNQAQQKQDAQRQPQDSAQSQADQKQDQQKQASQASSPQNEKAPSANEASEVSPASPGQLTPQQARQLLDTQKADEAMLPPDLKDKPAPSDRKFKDW